MTKRQKNFLRKLADLCDQYDVQFEYTTDDDGIHISVDNEEVFVGHMVQPGKELREAAV